MLKKIIVIFLSLIFALIIFELFLKYSPFKYGASPVKYDSQIGMWHKKNYIGYTIKECYKTKYKFNSKGLPSSIYKYDLNKKDVILLGDSYIEAIMVQNKNIIHNALAKEFHGKYNFLNYGLSSTSPVQQFIILKDKVNLYNTKYIIQFIQLEGDLMDVNSKNLSLLARPKVFMNFKDLNHYQIIPPRNETFYDYVGDILDNYQLYTFIKKLLYYIKDNIISKNNQSSIKVIPKKNKELFNNWLFLEGAIHQTNKYIKILNGNIKYKVIVNSKNNKNKIKIKNFLENEGIEFIFLDDMLEINNIRYTIFKCDGHWDDELHKNIAKMIKNSGFIK